jgi:hypothetical protein
MPLPMQHIESELSMAYVQAVVAKAGAYYNPYKPPEYGLDCDIRLLTTMPDGSITYTGHALNCQVKSTTNCIEQGDQILYDLEAKAYNKLVAFEIKTAILIVLKLPKDENDWLKCEEDCLELRNCCYWVVLDGPPTANTSTIRISIPRHQIFNPSAVSSLLDFLKQNDGSLL